MTTPIPRRRLLGWGAAALAAVAGAGALATALSDDGKDGQRQPSSPPDLHDVEALHDRYQFEQVTSPGRTIVRDQRGTLVAELTHGARTVHFTGPQRTFTEPATTSAKVATTSWVWPAAAPFDPSQLVDEKFAAWFINHVGSSSDDVLGSSCEYVTGRPNLTRDGVAFAGDAGFGLIHDYDTRDGADFYDYLGIAWTWPDGTVSRPDKRWARKLDCSGFLRLVYGYRMGIPLYRTNRNAHDGMPRTAFAIAERASSVTIAESEHADESPRDLSRVVAGDLVFFAAHDDEPTLITHSGIVLGKDQNGGTRFVSSRGTADGPTFGDVGGAGTLESGFFSRRLRKIIRL